MNRSVWRGFLCLLILISVFSRAHERLARGAESEARATGGEVFVTVLSKQGAIASLLPEVAGQRLRGQIDAAIKSRIGTNAKPTAVSQQEGMKISLATTTQLEAFPEAKAAIQRAAAKWEGMIKSPITVKLQMDFGTTLFGGAFPSTDALAVTVVRTQAIAYPVLVEELIRTTPDVRERSVYELLPEGNLLTENGTPRLIDLTTPNAGAVELLISGFDVPHTIGFNAKGKFDFDPRDGVDADKLDFEVLVLREIGRTLGFISKSGAQEVRAENSSRFSTYAEASFWDVYRFRNEASLSGLNNLTRASLSGGSQLYFAGGQALPLSTARPDGKGGDGRAAAHWKDDQLTGQYLGIMDPTFVPGERGEITAGDLNALDYFGYDIAPNAPVSEVLSNADASAEESLPLNGAMVVSRLSPSRFPCTVQAVRVQFPTGASPVGQSLRVVLFADAARSGRPPVNPAYLLDRTVSIGALPESRMLEILLPNVPAINGGDVYLGLQATGLSLAGDASPSPARSFISRDNAASFQPLVTAGQTPVNLIARAVAVSSFSASPIPRIDSVSPERVASGGNGLTIRLYGQHFFGAEINNSRVNSIVRWNGQDRPTEYINGSVLEASLYDVDLSQAGTGRLTVFTPLGLNQGLESGPFEIAITPNLPAPLLQQLTPTGAAPGEKDVTLKLYGKSFSPTSVVRWSGKERRPVFISSTELRLPLVESDLAGPGNLEFTVFTPGPGGGTSDPLPFSIAPCRYIVTKLDIGLAASDRGQGLAVDAADFCRWSAVSDVSWLRVTDGNDKLGRGYFGYESDTNLAAGSRTGTITVGDVKITLRQSGFAQATSAASFSGALAPESIASLFSLGLGTTTTSASATPLPTKLENLDVRVRSVLGTDRLAPLFFVSPEQINFQVPAGTNLGNATVFVYRDNAILTYGTVTIAAVAPGLFAANANGQGVPAAVALRIKADGTQRYEPVAEFSSTENRFVPRPLDLGPEGDRVFLLLFGTGIRGRNSLDAVNVKVGGLDAAVSFAGAQGGFAGLDQINIELPTSLRGRGEVPIQLTAGGRDANALRIAIK